MIGRPGKWPWKKGSLIVTALMATIRFVEHQLLDPVDEQHGIAMRQRRHHPPDVERADGGGCRRVGAHRPWGCGCAGCCACGSGVTLTDGRAALSAARTSLVTSSAGALASVAFDVDRDVGAASGHHLVDDRVETRVDLAKHILLDRLDVLLEPWRPPAGPRSACVWKAWIARVERGLGGRAGGAGLVAQRCAGLLDRLRFGLERLAELLWRGCRPR